MAGEHPDDKADSQPDEYYSRPVWQRCLVALAGPFANIIFALVILWGMS